MGEELGNQKLRLLRPQGGVLPTWCALPRLDPTDPAKMAKITGQLSGSHPLKVQPRSVILFQLAFSFQEERLCFRLRSWRVKPGQSLNELRFFLSHFPPRRTSSKPTGPRSAPTLSCDDVLFVSAIQSSAMGAAASRRTINITTGLGSGAATALVATRPSLSSRRFLCLTRTIACWLVAKPCGGAWRSTALGKRRRLRSKTRIACPTPPRSAAGPRA